MRRTSLTLISLAVAAVLATACSSGPGPSTTAAPSVKAESVAAAPAWNVPPACSEAIRLAIGFTGDLDEGFAHRPSDAAFVAYYPVWANASLPALWAANNACSAALGGTPSPGPAPVP